MLQNQHHSRELQTIRAMVKIYCRKHHITQNSAVCADCNDFLEYAIKRLTACPFKTQKPTCSKCLIHCYKTNMQAKAKLIMRFSGPRMLWRHPLLALYHLLDGRREIPNPQSCRQTKKLNQLK